MCSQGLFGTYYVAQASFELTVLLLQFTGCKRFLGLAIKTGLLILWSMTVCFLCPLVCTRPLQLHSRHEHMYRDRCLFETEGLSDTNKPLPLPELPSPLPAAIVAWLMCSFLTASSWGRLDWRPGNVSQAILRDICLHIPLPGQP